MLFLLSHPFTKEENATVAVYCEFMEALGVRPLLFSQKSGEVAIFLPTFWGGYSL